MPSAPVAWHVARRGGRRDSAAIRPNGLKSNPPKSFRLDSAVDQQPAATSRDGLRLRSDLPPTSAEVRSAHHLDCRLDVPPGFGFLIVALLLKARGLLGGLGNGLVAVCLQQLPRVVLYVDLLHPHGVILLIFTATGSRTTCPLKVLRRCAPRRKTWARIGSVELPLQPV